jgi:hypothetical protein
VSKYGAKKCELHGFKFDSIAEMQRYAELSLLVRAKEIEDLRVHPKHDLVVNGEKIGTYSPDFSYFQVGRGVVYEDVKSVASMTPTSSLKIRIFQALLKTKVVLIGKNVPRVRSFKSGGKRAA